MNNPAHVCVCVFTHVCPAEWTLLQCNWLPDDDDDDDEMTTTI